MSIIDFDQYIESSERLSDGYGYYTEFRDDSGDVVAECDRVVAVTVFGSHLYGTSGPESDLDLKGIYLNDLHAALFKNDCNRQYDSDPEDGREFDLELIELRTFIEDALQGQTYSLEMLHTPDHLQLLTTNIWDDILCHRDRIVSSHVMPFIGYCRQQASKYSMKGERLSVIEDVLDAIEFAPPHVQIQEYTSDFPEHECVTFYTQTLDDQDNTVEMVEIAGKKFELHAPVGKLRESMESLQDQYGSRAHRAKEDGVDWKATYHAYRVAYELEELLTQGELTFPLGTRERLKEIKEGRVDYETVQEELPELIDRAVGLEDQSDLRDEPDRAFMEAFLEILYRRMFAEEPYVDYDLD